MPDEVQRLRESLLTAYEIIRQQTKLICDLSTVVMPLVRAVVNEEAYDHLSLGEAYSRCSDELADESERTTRQTLAVVDEAIRRLREI